MWKMYESKFLSDWGLFKGFSVRVLDASTSVGSGVLGVYVTHESHSRHVFCRPSDGRVWGTLITGGGNDTRNLDSRDPLEWFDFLRGS